VLGSCGCESEKRQPLLWLPFALCHPEYRAGLDNLWWAESAAKEKTLRDRARRLDSEDAAHDKGLDAEDPFTIAQGVDRGKLLNYSCQWGRCESKFTESRFQTMIMTKYG
jgi:hypothetical protein